ncbi:MAG: hypothetical protein K1X75_01075 [Leptospirales bacterium]|nr:hypothetical protein [Leptospirales bacterium]
MSKLIKLLALSFLTLSLGSACRFMTGATYVSDAVYVSYISSALFGTEFGVQRCEIQSNGDLKCRRVAVELNRN